MRVDTQIERSAAWFASQVREVASIMIGDQACRCWPYERLTTQLHRTGVVFTATPVHARRDDRNSEVPRFIAFLDDEPRPITQADITFAREMLRACSGHLILAEERGDIHLMARSAQEYFAISDASKIWAAHVDRVVAAHVSSGEELPTDYKVPPHADRRFMRGLFWEMRSTLLQADRAGLPLTAETRTHFALSQASHDDAFALLRMQMRPRPQTSGRLSAPQPAMRVG